MLVGAASIRIGVRRRNPGRRERTFIRSDTRTQSWRIILSTCGRIARNPRAQSHLPIRPAIRTPMPHFEAPESSPDPTSTDLAPNEPTDPLPAAIPAQRSRSPRPIGAVKGFVAALALALTFGAGVGIGRAVPDITGGGQAAASPSGSDAELALIREAWDAIHQNYVDARDLNDQALAYGAINGLTDAVGDTGHTSFMTPEERTVRESALSGSYVGIGAEMDTTTDGLPLVVGVFRGSPADGAGLRSGDIVVAVDGKQTAGSNLDTVISWVRGAAGTSVVLTVKAGADAPERTIKIVRADVQIQPVSWAMAAGTKTAVIRLEQFSKGASDALIAALKAARSAGAERLVLDLRGNPGGYVGEAVGVASQFLASGTVYIERNAKGEEKPSLVTPGGIATDLPLVVVVDHGTASASEIVAGAIQDAGRAKVVGVTTFGTGTVLGEFPLSDGSALRIGTVEWLTPKGRVIWHAGITPDVVVDRADTIKPVVPDDLRSMSAAQVAQIRDPQLKKALDLAAAAN
jgi:carboxyl-terminal processing protease